MLPAKYETHVIRVAPTAIRKRLAAYEDETASIGWLLCSQHDSSSMHMLESEAGGP